MVRPLSKELQKIAIEELHENPERVEEDIKHMQEWIKQQPHLNAPIVINFQLVPVQCDGGDKQWILGFLRGSKFSLQTTKQKFDMYYNFKNILPEFIEQLDINSVHIQAILRAGIILPLPYFENYKGPKILLIRYQNFDTSTMNHRNYLSLLCMIMNILLAEDDNFIISGITAWFDLSCFPWGLILQITPSLPKTFFYYVQNVYPVRIKGLHATGSFILAEKLFNLIKGYLGPKLTDRIFLYSGDNFEKVYENIPKNYMPKEYGGENSNVEEIRAYWINKVKSYSTWFTENNQYGTNEALRPGKQSSLEDGVGIDGSFRKLNID